MPPPGSAKPEVKLSAEAQAEAKGPTMTPDDAAKLGLSRHRWVDAMMEKFFGKRPEKGEGQKEWDRLGLLEKYETQKVIVRVILGKMYKSVFRSFEERLQAEESVREKTRDELDQFRVATEKFFESTGRHFRAYSGNPEVAEEADTILMRNFIMELGRIENPEEFVDIVLSLNGLDTEEALRVENAEGVMFIPPEDRNFIAMLDELYRTPNGEMLGISQVAAEDPEQARKLVLHYAALRHLAGRMYTGKISDRRRAIEASLLGGIVSKMNTDQRREFFAQFFKSGQQGVEEAEKVTLDLIRTGNLTWLDFQNIIRLAKDRAETPQEKEAEVEADYKRTFGQLDTPGMEQKAEAAAREFKEAQKTLETNVRYVKQRFHGNFAMQMLTAKNIFLGVGGVLLGASWALVNGMVEVSSGVEEGKGFAGKIKGALKGLLRVNHYAAAGFVMSGFGMGVLSKGAVREKILYSKTKEEKAVARKRAIEKNLKAEVFGQHPGLMDYLLGKRELRDRYEPLMDHARINQAEGRGYTLRIDSDADMIVTDLDLEALGFSVPLDKGEKEKVKQEARRLIRDTFLEVHLGLGISSAQELDNFFKTAKFYG